MSAPAFLAGAAGTAELDGAPDLLAWAGQALPLPPRHTEPSPLQLQVPLLFWLAQQLRPAAYVNLGSHGSAAHLCVCQAVQTFKLSTRCYGMGSSVQALPSQLREQHDHLYSAFSRLLPAACDDDGLQHFRCDSIDWLQVDSLAELEQLQANWRSWRRRLSERAVLTVHQAKLAQASPSGGWLARLQKCHPWGEFTHGEGMLIIGVGSERPPAMQQLFHLLQDEFSARLVRAFFERLGEAYEQACQATPAGEGLPPSGLRPALAAPGAQEDSPQEALGPAWFVSQAAEHAAQLNSEEVRGLMLRMRETRAQVQALEQDLRQTRSQLQQQDARLQERYRELGRLSAQFEERVHALLAAREQGEQGQRMSR